MLRRIHDSAKSFTAVSGNHIKYVSKFLKIPVDKISLNVVFIYKNMEIPI